GMRSKAIERLQRIQQLFPHEEDRNPDLHQLYMSAGMTPRYADSAPAPVPVISSTTKVSAAPVIVANSPASDENADVSHFTRVAEITRKLYRQSNADAVMTTSANELGAQWKVSRCIVAMRKPGLAPTAVKEFCAEGFGKGDSNAVAGVMKRASYLDLLMAETRRAIQQNTPLTVVLMQFGKSSVLVRENGEKAVENAMQQIGQIIAANIRQNDLAFSYEMTTVAIVLG